MEETVCCIDVGTTRLKVALLGPDGGIRALASAPMQACADPDDRFKFDAEYGYGLVCSLINQALKQWGEDPRRVAAITVTGQRATIVPTGADGLACGRAISWQDPGPGPAIDRFMNDFNPARFRRITGLPPSSLWSLGKILRMKEADPELFAATSRFALVHDYILHHLGARELIADYSNASVSGLFDLESMDWSDEILAAVGITESRLPRLAPAGSRVGVVDEAAAAATGLLPGTPLVMGGGDQECAALGGGAIDPGQAFFNLGTAAVLSCPVDAPAFDETGEFFCSVHVVPGRWVIEGIHNCFSGSLTWLAETLGLKTIPELETLLTTKPANLPGVLFLPFLAGIGSPDYDADVRGALVDLQLNHTPADIARGVVEGIILETRRILDAVEARVSIRQLVIGGMTGMHHFLLQVMADLCRRQVYAVSSPEITLTGAAILAWAGINRFESISAGSRALSAAGGCTVETGPGGRVADERYRHYLDWVQLAKSGCGHDHDRAS